ncbi:MAG: hypothetical protein J6Y82_11600 [Bacteroidales bacterium]|nr:hypothetical protein [Bacteroidales bacterium]
MASSYNNTNYADVEYFELKMLKSAAFDSEDFVLNDNYYAQTFGYPVRILGAGGDKALFGSLPDPEPGNIEKNYKTITLGKYITEIKKNAFKGFVNITTITLNCEAVPTVASDAFTDCAVDEIIVNVPDALYSQYKSSTWASIFAHIVSPSNPTAVEEVSIENAKVVNMKILFGQEVEVEVYSITGAPIYKGIASEVSLPEKGIYIIRSGNKTKKVVCK